MNTLPKFDPGRLPLHLPVRRISVSTIYAWTRVIAAYERRHPGHRVLVFYHHHGVQDMKLLVKHDPQIDSEGFSIGVDAPPEDWQDVTRLAALLEHASGPELTRFLTEDNPDIWFTQATSAGRAN